MAAFSKDELLQLAERVDSPSISLYLPINRASAELQHDQLEVKTRLKNVLDTLRAEGMSKPKSSELLEAAIDFATDKTAWLDRRDGLALFVAPSFFRTYWLPIAVPPLTVIGPRFHVKPLFPLLYGDGKFCILAFSQKSVRLLECTRFDFREIELRNVPRSLRESNEEVPRKQTSARPTGVNAGQPMYYSMGAKTDVIKDEIEFFFRDVDHGLHQTLQAEGVPVVLAAVEYLIPMYRSVSSYPHLLDEGVTGNPELLSAAELHARAWEVVRPIFQQPEAEALTRYQELRESERASTKVLKILNAAYIGQVDALFVAVDRQQWGKFDPESGSLQSHQEPTRSDSDVLDLAAVQSLKHHGSVYALPASEMPDGALAAAIFRPALAPNL